MLINARHIRFGLGVLAGAVLACVKAPFILVVAAAAGTAAVLRLTGFA